MFVNVNKPAVEAAPTVDCKVLLAGERICADASPAVNRQSIATNEDFMRRDAANPTKRWLNICFPSRSRPDAHRGDGSAARRTQVLVRYDRAERERVRFSKTYFFDEWPGDGRRATEPA